MLVNAMNAYQVKKREHKENVKGQYLDKTGSDGAKNYFRASELGSADRKIMYSFFAHNLPKSPKTAQNLRQLENGDFVHDRYQSAWEEMGILISMEERLSSKDDEYLAEFEWEWAGHYDGLLDVNIMRAHALDKATIKSVFNEETEEWEIEVELDEAYANAIGIFDEEGNLADDYEPLPMIADIKTMNPWGFKVIKDKADISNIGGYLDQIMFYMYMHNTPYGSIFIESKDNNDVVEVQVLWKDMHTDIEYQFEEDIHGKQDSDKVRVVVTSERFFGSEQVEGCVPRIERLWQARKAIMQAEKDLEAGKITSQEFHEVLMASFPERCSDIPDKFPCSWGHKQGKITTCEFYDHCWNKQHGGKAIKPYEAVPAEAVWEFENENDTIIRIDNRKVPKGVDYDGFINLVGMGVLDYTLFLIEDVASVEDEADTSTNAHETAMHADNLFDNTGSLNLGAPAKEGVPTEAKEYLSEDNKKAIDCLNCGKQVTYQKLGAGNVKKCPHCNHRNQVVRD